MSERWQKIFKVIVWIVLLITVGVFIENSVNSYLNPKVTMDEWMSMLNGTFGVEENIVYGDDEVMGRDIVITSFSFISDGRLSNLTKSGAIDDDSIIDLAIQSEIISPSQLNRTFSDTEAEKTLNRFMEFYMNPNNYPVFEDVTLNQNIDNGIDANIIAHNEDYTSCIISNYIPQEGHIVVLMTDDGNGIARRIVSYETNSNDSYDMILEDVDNIEDVIDVLSFSGYAFVDNETLLSKGDLGDVEISINNIDERQTTGELLSIIEPSRFTHLILVNRVMQWMWF